MKQILLNTAYFPPIQYLSKVFRAGEVLVEQYESYDKQSYRNRCDIMFANGVMTLTVPIVKPGTVKFFTKDALVDYTTNWQKIHFKSIESAYKNSPFYEYYIDDFIPFFKNKEKYLLDLNSKILLKVLENMDIKRKIIFTDDYIPESGAEDDFRNVIHPKVSKRPREDNDFIAIPYDQTFNDRFPFIPNLSVLDLLFNTGPEAKNYL